MHITLSLIASISAMSMMLASYSSSGRAYAQGPEQSADSLKSIHAIDREALRQPSPIENPNLVNDGSTGPHAASGESNYAPSLDPAGAPSAFAPGYAPEVPIVPESGYGTALPPETAQGSAAGRVPLKGRLDMNVAGLDQSAGQSAAPPATLPAMPSAIPVPYMMPSPRFAIPPGQMIPQVSPGAPLLQGNASVYAPDSLQAPAQPLAKGQPLEGLLSGALKSLLSAGVRKSVAPAEKPWWIPGHAYTNDSMVAPYHNMDIFWWDKRPIPARPQWIRLSESVTRYWRGFVSEPCFVFVEPFQQAPGNFTFRSRQPNGPRGWLQSLSETDGRGFPTYRYWLDQPY